MPNIYWALNEQGRLYIPDKTPESLSYDYEDRNVGSFYLNDEGRITADIIPNSVNWELPYPAGIWYLQENSKLHCGGIPDDIKSGAFCGSSTFVKVVIPENTKSIGNFAFYGTALSGVKIASDCSYSQTSFPEGCEISFYPEENN